MTKFFNQEVTGHVASKNTKSHGTIIDNLSDYSEDKYQDMNGHMRGLQTSVTAYLRVPEEFIRKFPDMKYEKAEKYYNTYLQSIRTILLRRLPFIRSNYTHISLDKLWYNEFQYKNKRHYIWEEFKQIRPFFYILPDKIGNGRKRGNPFEQNSEVYMMNQKLIDLLIDTADTSELVALYYGELDNDTINTLEVVPIDMNSLCNFIGNTQHEIEKSENNSKHQAKLYQNLRQAKYIKIISEFFYDAYGSYVLPQIPNPSVYGRMYYKGINIQNINKEVRSAVLGEHYVYDLNAAVYAIKLMLVKKIHSDRNESDYGKYTYTKEYLDYKSTIRNQLSKHIQSYPNNLELVKRAITAIGFGARIGGGSWQVDGLWQTSSIEDILMNKDDRNRFMNDPWIKEFVKEQYQMTKTISDDFISSNGFVESVINVPKMFKNGKIRKSQVMSYVFQHTEKAIMDIITQDIDVIARVHDSFITKNKLTLNQLTDIKLKLNSMEPLLTIECEEFHAWINKNDLDYEDELHEQRIKQEEIRANGYYIEPKKVKQVYKKRFSEDFYDGSTDYGDSHYYREEVKELPDFIAKLI